MSINKKILAFTLAETLIVMGIIGVIAALTIPNLSSSTGNKEVVTKVLKARATLSESLLRSIAVHGKLGTWKLSSGLGILGEASQIIGARLFEEMKTQLICKDTVSACYEPVISNGLQMGDFSSATLADGSAIKVVAASGYNEFTDGSLFATVEYDIDGPNKGYNKACKDRFKFALTNKGINTLYGSKTSNISSDSAACASWIMQFGNADFMKVKNSDGKTCPSGKVLDWVSNTTCN